MSNNGNGARYDDYDTESDRIHFLSLNHEVLFRINGYWNFIPKNARAKRKIQSIFYKLKEGDTHHEITYTEEEKDLGVVIDGIYLISRKKYHH